MALLGPERQFHFSPSKYIWKEITCRLMEKGQEQAQCKDIDIETDMPICLPIGGF